MRKIITISVSEKLKNELDEYMKTGGYASVSELFREMFRAWKRSEGLVDEKNMALLAEAAKSKKLRAMREDM